MVKNFNLGCKKSPHDPRDFKYSRAGLITELPKSVDLRNKQSDVRDQKNLGACTGFASTSAIEYYKRSRDKNFIFSPLMVYYEGRLLEGTEKYDDGAYIRDVLKQLKNIGVCLELYWRYDVNKFTESPSWTAMFNARFHRIKSFEQLDNLNQVLHAVATGDVVICGFEVFENIYGVLTSEKGWVSIPKETEKSVGGHAVLVVGYDLDGKYLIIKNSWGKEFGAYGFLYMPFAYFEKFLFDAWRIVV